MFCFELLVKFAPQVLTGHWFSLLHSTRQADRRRPALSEPLSKQIPTCKAEARSTRNSASSLSKITGLKGKACVCNADGRQAEDPSYRLSGEQGQGPPHLWLNLLSVPSHAAPAGTGQTAPSTLGQQHKETPRSSQSHEVYHPTLVGQVSPN